MFALAGVRYAYGAGGFQLAVDELAVGRGERVACVGPSGSGKTTLVDLIAGIRVPDAGTVHLAGERLSTLSDDARRVRRITTVGMVFQEFELLDYLSALDNVLLPYHLSRELELSDAVRERALELARETGIAHVLARRPRRLSQGERQRVAVCRALVTEPTLLLCDEATGNLDPETAKATLDLLLEQAATRRASVFLVTHDHGILDRFDRVVDMRELGGAA